MLALDFLCRAVYWLVSILKLGGNLCIRMEPNTFDDLDYADDLALLPHDITLTGALLERIDEEAGHLGLHMSLSRAKTKIQNMVYGGEQPALSLRANKVDSVS